jgi:hypothetical protein
MASVVGMLLLLPACADSKFGLKVACEPDPPSKPLVPSSAYGDKTVMGERYQHGIGVAADPKAAAGWYLKGAFTPPSSFPVYMPGYGKVPGTVLAIPRPAETGDPVAIAHLGWLYIQGDVLPFDEARGRELLACAAARGVNARDMPILSGTPENIDRKTFDHG